MAEKADGGPIIRIRDRFVEARFLGKFTVERFNAQMDAAAEACSKAELRHLLVDAGGLRGNLSTNSRYEIGKHAASAASGIRVAVHSPLALADPKKFGVLVARNRGLDVELFLDRDQALGWLLSPGS